MDSLPGRHGLALCCLASLLCATLSNACSPVSPNLDTPSPTGRIAFISGGENQNFQPFVGPAAGGSPIQLVTDLADYTGLSWSLDGKRLAFASSRAGRAIYALYIMDVAEANVERVYGTETTSVFAPSWSPDGTRIVFQKQGTPQTGWDLWIVNADGTDPRALIDTNADEELSAWSPDGARIAYEGGRGSRNIFVIDADGTNPEQLTHEVNTVVGGPMWSPDGTRLIVHSTLHRGDQPRSAWGQFEIYSLDVSTQRLTRLTFIADENRAARMPSWSPDGTRIAFELQTALEGNFSFRYRINVMDADGSNVNELDFERGARFPRWAPK